jgi:hypothetical protein
LYDVDSVHIFVVAVVENSVRMRQDIGFIDRHSRERGNPVFSRENGSPEDKIPAPVQATGRLWAGIKTWIPAPFLNEASLKQQE